MTTPARTLHVGVVGLGLAAAAVMPATVAMPQVNLVAGADINPRALQAFREKYDARTYASIEALCDDPDVNTVWIATPNPLHCPHVLLAAERGKHVIVEKPMAISLAEAERMIEAAERHGVRLLCGGSRSSSAVVRHMRQVVASGALGRPRAMVTWSATDWMLRPRRPDELDVLYFPNLEGPLAPVQAQTNWVYWMINTPRPLEEKMALFWHQLFATGNSKVDNPPELLQQIAMFRRHGLGSFRTLLVQLAKNPAMIFWLDNNGNHAGAINENWGRELLELFSMGVGNYSEDDIKEASRAFTGWTIAPKLPRLPLGRFYWGFAYKPEDHDNGEKTFLGHTGRLNGEDIIDIVVQQPATARFLARHLYHFFVADEPQVPSWNITPPRDPEAIRTLEQAYTASNYDVRSVLRVLFRSDFFKQARFARVKSPAELVIGTVRLAGNFTAPRLGFQELAWECNYQGQELLNPPSVESWHTGQEWIDGGALVRRVNFAARFLGDTSLPGIRAIADDLRARGTLSPAAFVDGCLDLLGPLEVSQQTRDALLAQAEEEGELRWGTEQDSRASTQRVGVMLALIGASREYQFA